MDDEARWERLGARGLYSGRMRLTEYLVRLPTGETGNYEVDESIPFAVAVLIELGGRILVTRQYRFPVDSWIFDLPGGAGDVGESPETAARREVSEELGIRLDKLTPLQIFYPNPGRSAWPVYLFLATMADESSAVAEDPWESVSSLSLSTSQLRDMIIAGEVVDPSLLIAWQSATARGLIVE